MAMTKKQRTEVENLVYKYFDALDKSGTNTKYYKELFASLSDDKFFALMKKEFPIRMHYKPSVTEPSMTDIKESLDAIGVPLLETISLPYLYEDKDGRGVETQECIVGYIPHKKVQQIVTKKSKWGTDIKNRDMKSGRLLGGDKGSAVSDREFEALATMDLDYTMKEFYGPKADSMQAKNAMYNIIGTTGMVRLSDLPDSIDDSLAKNMFNAYLIAAHINSNLINQGDYTMYTIKERRRKTLERV